MRSRTPSVVLSLAPRSLKRDGRAGVAQELAGRHQPGGRAPCAHHERRRPGDQRAVEVEERRARTAPTIRGPHRRGPSSSAHAGSSGRWCRRRPSLITALDRVLPARAASGSPRCRQRSGRRPRAARRRAAGRPRRRRPSSTPGLQLGAQRRPRRLVVGRRLDRAARPPRRARTRRGARRGRRRRACPRTTVSWSLVSSRATLDRAIGPARRGEVGDRAQRRGAAPRTARSCAARRRARPAARPAPRPDAGQEPLEHEPRRREPADDEPRRHGRRAGHRRHVVAGVEHGPHQPLAGIADPRRAGVGHDRDVAAVAEHLEHLGDPRRLGVLVARPPGGRRAMPACCEQPPGAPRVLAADEGGRRRAPRRPRRQVAEVADRAWRRGRDGRARPLSHRLRPSPSAPSRSSTTSPIDRPHRSNAPASASITHAALHTGTRAGGGPSASS